MLRQIAEPGPLDSEPPGSEPPGSDPPGSDPPERRPPRSEPPPPPAPHRPATTLRRWRRVPALLGPPLLAFAVGIALLWFAADRIGTDLGRGSWGRWDSGHYLSIADRGYVMYPCPPGRVPPSMPGPASSYMCGNTAWLPLYPWVIRAVSALGPSLSLAGLVAALAAHLGGLVLVWAILRQTAPRGRAARAGQVACLLLAAVFPGMIYHHTIFPVAQTALLTLACLYLLARERWLLAGLAGAGAAASYPIGVLLAPVALLAGAAAGWRGRPRWRRLLGALLSATLVAAGLGAVFLSQRLTLGRWDAFFEGQRRFGNGLHDPVPVFMDTVRPAFLWLGGDRMAWPGAVVEGFQTFLVATVVVLAVGVTLLRRGRTRLDLLVACYTLVAWVAPHVASRGVGLSQYRSEALLLPVVVLTRHLPVVLRVPIVLASAVVAVEMAQLFWRLILR
jgi:hypothetical protein